MSLLVSPAVSLAYFGQSRYGRGVFARERIPAGALIDRAPVVLVPTPEIGPVVARYAFAWPDPDDLWALPAGLSMMLNHHDQPNVDYRFDLDGPSIELYANQLIESGEELLIDYAYDESTWERLGRPTWYRC
jgi:SET domain-containing protein